MKDWKAILKDPQLSKRLYSLLLCSFCLVVGSLAWFFNGKNGKTEAIDFVSVGATNFEISTDGTNYAYDVQIPFPGNLFLTPISGPGNSDTMYVPVLPSGSDDATEAEEWLESEYDTGADEVNFFPFTLYFRCDKAGYVILTGLDVSPMAAAVNRQGATYTDKNGNTVIVTSSDVERPIKSSADYTLITGKPLITKDYIAGAARLRIVNKTNDAETEGVESDVLFVPNDTYNLVCNISNGECSCSLNEQGTSDVPGSYYDGSGIVEYDDSVTVVTESEFARGSGLTIILLEDDGSGTYYGRIDLCLWIDGFDNEANEILAGGSVSVNLDFDFEALEEEE